QITDSIDRAGKEEDAQACERLLTHWEHFPSIQGTIVYRAGHPVAIGVSELVAHPSNPEGMLISHFEKADLSIEGLTVFNFQQLCASVKDGVIINRMQSAGNAQLSQWKQSWGPSGMGYKVDVGTSDYLGTNIPEPMLFGRPRDDAGFARPRSGQH
ncbi:MAG: hypothetical protein EBZ48_17390, partial [Proteobacteria bacterium]|nr:hypothetical protein [Pseudomonadota bacterium]